MEQVLALLLFQKYMFGDPLVLKEAVPLLVERAFGRIQIVDGAVRTVLNEPFVVKAAENYFMEKDSQFMTTLKSWMLRTDRPQAHGYGWELMMMNILVTALETSDFSRWPQTPPIFSQCAGLVGKVEIVGWDKQGLQCGITYEHITLQEFMDAHVNLNSTKDCRTIPPFFFPKAKPSGPDIIFFIRINSNLFPIFVQLKLRQGMPKKDVLSAIDSVSAAKIDDHIKDLRSFCPCNTFISMVIAYPATFIDKLVPRPDSQIYNLRPQSRPKNNDLTNVQVMIDKSNFAEIFPKYHVDFLNSVLQKRQKDSMEAECSKKTRV